MLKNKSLAVFIGVGFIITLIIWGFVGGCGTTGLHRRAAAPSLEEPNEDERGVLEEVSIPEGTVLYKVEPGDTLWGISRRFGVSVADIKEVNNLTRDTISIGQRMVIPMKEDILSAAPAQSRITTQNIPDTRPITSKKVTGDLVVYKVRKGDSLWRIAQIYGTTVEKIAELNGIPKNARLKPGQELLIPNAVD